MNTISRLVVRVGIGATLAVSGVIHAYLYIHGYRSHPHHRPGVPAAGQCFLRSGRADPRRRTGLAAVGRGCVLRRRAGRVRAVAHRRALRVHRTRMAAVTARRRQRDRRGAHRGIGCRLGAEQPQQNRSNITAVTQIAAGRRRRPFYLAATVMAGVDRTRPSTRVRQHRDARGRAAIQGWRDGDGIPTSMPCSAVAATNMRRHHACFSCY